MQVASSSPCERNYNTYAFIHVVKINKLGLKKAENLVYIHSTLRLVSQKYWRYKEGPFKRWDQYTYDVIYVDEDIEPYGLVDLPQFTIDEQKTQLESDFYL